MILMQTLLNQLKMKDALLFHSVTLTEAQAISISLVKAGFIRIPRGYLRFLSFSDGLAWNGVELFACIPHERAGTVFNQPDLLEYQTKYARGRFFAHRLILGRALESLICYDADNKCYELLNRDTLNTMLKFPRFEDMLYYLIFEK